MKIHIDEEARTLVVEDGPDRTLIDLYSKEAFEVISRQWVRVGWNQKYQYTFTWLGRPVIQLPEDLIRVQEVIWRIKPDVIVETGIAHGGSLLFYASLCKIIGRGKVIGVDVEIRANNRRAILEHELSGLVTLIEGDSTAPDVVERVREAVGHSSTVLVILDSNHSREHVWRELMAYHPLVTPGSYIVVTDGIMADLHDVPRGSPDWRVDNPISAAGAFVDLNTDFVVEHPPRPFSESELAIDVSHWPCAWVLRKAGPDAMTRNDANESVQRANAP